MEALGHSALSGSGRSEFFLASYVKSVSGNWFVLGPKEQSKKVFSKSCPFKLRRKKFGFRAHSKLNNIFSASTRATLRVDPVGGNAENLVPLKMVTKRKVFGLGQ